MSIAKLHVVNRAQKDQGTCGKCGVQLPKGAPYQWWQHFRSFKQKRCTGCTPKMSERESRDKIAQVMAAQEDFNVSEMTSVEDITAAVEEVAGIAHEMAEEYRAASEGEQGQVFNEQAAETGDELDSAADELDGWEPNRTQPDSCNLHEDNPYVEQPDGLADEDICEECEGLFAEWIEEVRAEADDAVNGMELP